MSDKPGDVRTAFPPGHFYSPVVDPAEVARRQGQIWPAEPQVRGIDFDDEGHRRILTEVFPRYLGEYDYPNLAPQDETRAHPGFYSRNPAFGWLDSRALFVLLRHWRPRRLIEVGSGFSTLLIADVNARFLDGSLNLTAIEPYPMEFLRSGVDGLARLVEEPVQNVPLEEFERLAAGDVLFIDSSHVAKTGSDVNFLFFEVLPRLTPGVRIHVHDIFLPHDYPRDWVSNENRSWNEQYLLRALLMYSDTFRVVFGSSYAAHHMPDLVARALPEGRAMSGGSLWMERRF